MGKCGKCPTRATEGDEGDEGRKIHERLMLDKLPIGYIAPD